MTASELLQVVAPLWPGEGVGTDPGLCTSTSEGEGSRRWVHGVVRGVPVTGHHAARGLGSNTDVPGGSQ